MNQIIPPFVVVCLLLVGGCLGVKSDPLMKHDAVISTGIDSSGDPVDNVQTIGLSNGRVVLRNYWRGLPKIDSTYKVELLNSNEEVVYRVSDKIPCSQGDCMTTTWYTFKDTDGAGFWKFKIYRNYQLVGEKPLMVTGR